MRWENTSSKLFCFLAALVLFMGCNGGSGGRDPAGHPSIQAAINAAGDGDTVVVEAGVYRENLTITKEITLRGAGMGETILSSSGNSPAIAVYADNVALEGFTVDASYSCRAGIYAEDSAGLQVLDCEVKHAEGFGGIYLRGCREALVSRCVIESNLQNGVVVSDGSTGTVSESRVISNGRNGVDSDRSPYLAVIGCEILFNGTNPDFPYHNGIGMGNGTVAYIDGNLIEGNRGAGIGFDNVVATIVNNTIINNVGRGIDYLYSDVHEENNILYGNGD